jgi:hypothetical protein
MADDPIATLGKPEKFDDDTAEMDRAIDAARALRGGKDKAPVEEPEEPDYVMPEPGELIREEDERIEGKPEEKEEEEEPSEELIEESARGLDLKRIREKFPEFAKTHEYKELKNAYYRESQYTEMFPTLDDAREAAENNETFTALNDSLVGRGDPTQLLETVKQASPESFRRIAVTFLDHLSKVDQTAYVAAVDPLVRRVAQQMNMAGRRYLSQDPNSTAGHAMVTTARNIMQFYYDDANEINRSEAPPVDTRLSEKEQELSNREQAIVREKFESAYRVAHSSVERNLDAQIRAGLDPDNRLSDFTKDALVEKIKRDVENQISADQNHLRKMTSLWKRSESTGYSRDSLSRIVSAYLERARPIIPSVRTQYRSRAIGRASEPDEQRSVENRGPQLVRSGRTGRPPSESGRGGSVKSADPRKIDYSKTSDEDIFEGRVKLKGS